MACETVVRVGRRVVDRIPDWQGRHATQAEIDKVLMPYHARSIWGAPSVKLVCTGKDKAKSKTLMGLRRSKKKRCKFGVSKTTGKCLKRRRK